MAQLKDTVVSGSLRATDTLYSTTAQFQILRAPTASNGTTFGPGSANNLLKSNGTSVYWTTLLASDIPNLSTDKSIVLSAFIKYLFIFLSSLGQ